MKIEFPAFERTALGRAVVGMTRRVQAGFAAARAAYRVTTDSPKLSEATLRARAEQLGQDVLRLGLSIRSSPVPPPDLNLGAYKSFSGTHPTSPATAAAMASRDARYAQTTAGAGQTPLSMAAMPEITLGTVAEAQRLCHRSGWTWKKADIDQRQRRDDSHVKAVDLKLRSWPYKAPLRIRARSASILSGLVAAAVRAAIDQLDGLTSSVGELGVVACAGYASAELVWRDCDLRVPVGGGSVVRVPSEIVGSLEQVYPRNVAFDIVEDTPWLQLGPNDFLQLNRPGLQKFLYLTGPEDGPVRFRGYGWANNWLSYLAGLGLEKFGHLITLFGIVTPYLQRDDTTGGYLTDDEHAHAIDILARLGTGQPEVIPGRYGTLEHSPVPASLTPMHQQFLGWCRTEQSKLISLQTLAVEIGAVGSQAAATVHADGLVDAQRIYATLTAEGMRSQLVRWLLQVNAARWALAFSRYVPGGCTPDDIEAELPIVEWILDDQTQGQRLAVFQGVKGLGFALDEEQVRSELRVLAPMIPSALAEQPTQDPKPAEQPAQPKQPEQPATEIAS